MVDEAKIRITIDPAQARRELDRIERAAPGQREKRVTGFSPSVAAGAGGATAAKNKAAQQAGGAPSVSAGGAVVAGGLAGRRFSTVVKTAVAAVIAEQTISKGFPILSELIKEGVREMFAGGTPLERDIADRISALVTGGLDKIEETIRAAKRTVATVIEPGIETASAAYGAALTGNQLSAGEIGDAFESLKRANEIQFDSKSRLKAQELRIATRNQGKKIKDFMAENLEGFFPRK